MKSSCTKDESEEQEICIQCGFCCDGTLFDHAVVYPKEVIREDLRGLLFSEDGSDFFNMPCPHSNVSCSVYNEEKPQVCSKYSCQVLKNVGLQKITKNDAISLVQKAISLKEDVIILYKKITKKEKTYLVEIVNFVFDFRGEQSSDFKMLKMKCNILNLLLIKEFKSEEEFDEYLMG